MGQKVHPKSFRIGVNKTWDSNWYADKKSFPKLIKEDHDIRQHLNKNYSHGAISKVNIERAGARLILTIYTSKPGVIIGSKGSGVEQIKKEISKFTQLKNVIVNVREIKNMDTNAALVAQSVAKQIEGRVSYKRAINQALQKTAKTGVDGVKIMVSGRLDGNEIASSIFYTEGSVPLHTLRSKIDFGLAEAMTNFGVIGVKVWIHNGEELEKLSPTPDTSEKKSNPRSSKGGKK